MALHCRVGVINKDTQKVVIRVKLRKYSRYFFYKKFIFYFSQQNWKFYRIIIWFDDKKVKIIVSRINFFQKTNL